MPGSDWLILNRALKRNIGSETEKSIINHEKKLTSLTKNNNHPFTHHEIVTNLSTYDLSHQLDLLRQGFQHSIPPCYLTKSDIVCSFELINRSLKEVLKNAEDAGDLKSDLSLFSNSFYCNYYPTEETLNKHGILKLLRSNTRIVILKSDKVNGVVLLDIEVYHVCILKIINDKSKFRNLNNNVTRTREGQSQRFFYLHTRNMIKFTRIVLNLHVYMIFLNCIRFLLLILILVSILFYRYKVFGCFIVSFNVNV